MVRSDRQKRHIIRLSSGTQGNKSRVEHGLNIVDGHWTLKGGHWSGQIGKATFLLHSRYKSSARLSMIR